jgi:hypothetical protein
MGDARAGRHPIDLARPDRLDEAQAVAVQDFALEQLGQDRQAYMGMGPHIHALAHRKDGQAQLVEENERPDHAPPWRGQVAAALFSASFAGCQLIPVSPVVYAA